MKRTQSANTPVRSARLIIAGLGLAGLGAGSVCLLILALTHLYVARYAFASAEALACITGGAAFFLTYGRYLDRLESWTRGDAAGDPPVGLGSTPVSTELQGRDVAGSGPGGAQPLPTDTVVASVSAAYGFIIILSGAIWTRGADLALNLISGMLFLVCAVIVAWLGRRSRQGGSAV